MSGHSKWSTIKRKKGAQDARRSKIFAKLIREITIAARLGGSDPDANSRLRQAIATAKVENMPADNIKRAISKAEGGEGGEDFIETVYEGYGAGGAAILIDALTDNKNRTTAEVRHVFSKHDASLGSANCVAWLFDRKGYILVEKDAVDENKLMEVAIEAGAEDIRDSDDIWEVLSEPEDFDALVKAFEDENIKTVEAKIAKIPQNTNNLNKDEAGKLMSLLEDLEDLDDVQNVWSNFDVEE